jgi:CRP/FNR family transcriptional regulator, cyclic AMP receptor protein
MAMGAPTSFDKLIQHAENVKAYKAGQIIFSEGDAGDYMYVVKSGEVDIRVRDRVAATIVQGGVFGEMALLDKAARSGTALARTDCEVVPIDEKRFVFMVQQTPFFALELMKLLAQRLRTMDQLF